MNTYINCRKNRRTTRFRRFIRRCALPLWAIRTFDAGFAVLAIIIFFIFAIALMSMQNGGTPCP